MTDGVVISHGKATLLNDPGYGSDYTLLVGAEDFKWYKRTLDLQVRRELRHVGEPEIFPCFVYSRYDDSDCQPDVWQHNFIYREKHECDSCGHISYKWPKLQETL